MNTNPQGVIAAVLVASDTRSTGKNRDLTGPAAREALAEIGIGVVEISVIADDIGSISEQLSAWTDRPDIALILTAGGTGLTPRDVTPEATKMVIEKDAPGIAEMLRAESLRITPHAALSRGVAGVRNKTLIINLPGSPKAVAESIGFLAPILSHALETVTGRAVECATRSH